MIVHACIDEEQSTNDRLFLGTSKDLSSDLDSRVVWSRGFDRRHVVPREQNKNRFNSLKEEYIKKAKRPS